MQQSQTIDVLSYSEEALPRALADHQIALTPEEVITISRDILNGRAPTVAELILWSIQGSEHCSYKSTKKYLKQLPNQAPHVVIAGKEDAGVIRIATDESGKHYCLVLSHESHNHPSQIVPFEGAATGVGGNVRDVCCMGAEVIAVADGLRFGSLSQPETHWINEGVVSGIASYANSIGVPNLAGDVYYHPAYNQNCLVTVVTLGIVEEDAITHSYAPKYEGDLDFILVGKPTDNSGFGGASFASADLNEEDREANKGAVQEPNPFLERHLLKASYALFEELKKDNLIEQVGFKDLGAGGIACASVEIAEGQGLGATIHLDQVQTAMPGLRPEVILCAETQERFMWCVPPSLTPRILEHYNKLFDLPNVSKYACAAVVGHTTTDGQYKVTYQGEMLVDAPAESITQGLKVDRASQAPTEQTLDTSLPPVKQSYQQDLEQLISHVNIACKKTIYQHYDKQVQGRVIVERGAGCAGVVAPFNDHTTPASLDKIGIALAVAHNPYIGLKDGYACGVHAVIEACYKVIATGATPLAITDCLCFGNPEKSEQMYALIQGIKAIKDTCEQFCFTEHDGAPLPVVAGNVSLYNESDLQAIPASPMISAVGKIDNIDQLQPSTCDQAGARLFVVGQRADSLDHSIYQSLHDLKDTGKQAINIKQVFDCAQAMLDTPIQNIIRAVQVISEGGLAVALLRMLFNQSIGAAIQLNDVKHPAIALFGESPAFLVAVAAEDAKAFQAYFDERQLPCLSLGATNNTTELTINDWIQADIASLYQTWQTGLGKQL